MHCVLQHWFSLKYGGRNSAVHPGDEGVGLVWCAGLIAATSHNVCCAMTNSTSTVCPNAGVAYQQDMCFVHGLE